MLAQIAALIHEHALQPALHALGLMTYSERAYEWVWLGLLGAVYLVLLVALIAPLERWRPVETVTDTKAVRTDRWYTALVQLGVLPLLPSLILILIFDPLDGWLRSMGFVPWSMEDAFPALREFPALAFVVYLVAIDFVMYWLHRSQHIFKPLWELHAIHHSQQQMTYWSDAREHVLSYVYYAFMIALIGLVIGAGREGAFIAATFVVRFVQALSHANARISFGALGNRLVVSPQFHRVHHAIGIGHEGQHKGCNFAAVFSLWDVLFGTANLRNIYPRTGVRDQLSGRDYGRSLLAQQWLALKRLAGRA